MTGQIELRRSLWQRIKRTLIQDVPKQDKVCEFDCSHLECAAAKWGTCENRQNPLSQPQETITIKQRPLLNHIAGLWPYLLIATSIVGFVYILWPAAR
jgi:hypothetical protein